MSRWDIVELGQISKLINGDRGDNYPSKDDFVESGIPFVNAGHLSGGRVCQSEMNFISPQKFAALGSGKLQCNDIIYCLRGSLGKTAIYRSELPGAIASSLVIIRPNESCCVDFLFHYLTSVDGQRLIKRFDNGSSQPNLSAASVKTYPVPLPPLPVQKRIAEILDRAEELRAKRRAALALLDELTQSIFLDMFGDPVTNPKSLPRKRLGEIGKIVTGNTPSRIRKDYYGDFIEWIKSDNLNCPDYYATIASEGLSEAGLKVGRVAPPNSILITCIAGSPECIGNSAMVDRRVTFNQQINAIVEPRANPHFLYAQTILGKRLIQGVSSSGMKGIVSKGRLEGVEFILPPIRDQDLFADRAMQIESMKSRASSSVTELDQLFASLQHRVFRGEL